MISTLVSRYTPLPSGPAHRPPLRQKYGDGKIFGRGKKLRYFEFVAKTLQLTYYAPATTTAREKGKVRGVVSVMGAKVLGSEPHALEIATDKRNFKCVADDDIQRDEWVEAVEYATRGASAASHSVESK